MRKQLNTKEQWFASSEEEANKIIEEAKNEFPDELVGHSINLKSNKAGEYYLVKLEIKFNTPAGIMESELINDTDDETDEEWAEEETEDEENESEEK
ncbi:hypothetical protein [Enterococcus sp. 2201sp1_2201st1_B8_2201SCRN_220225]|uniref:hypothetical protein n=1 Tax=unclassified Enterococcus TaxID=2608891 RepID=UPI0034A329BC